MYIRRVSGAEWLLLVSSCTSAQFPGPQSYFPKRWQAAMPKLQLLGRNWRVASDDFVGLGIASLVGRIAWYIEFLVQRSAYSFLPNNTLCSVLGMRMLYGQLLLYVNRDTFPKQACCIDYGALVSQGYRLRQD